MPNRREHELCAHLTETLVLLRHQRRGVFHALLRPLWEGVTAVRLKPLRQGRKVLREGDVLWLDQDYCSQTYVAGDELSLVLCTLYFLHESLHLSQGMAEKETIRALRATGAEDTLMMVDLAADHAAVLLATSVRRGWSLQWLKELQGRSLAAFPVGPAHTPGARRRKCRRLAALRVDAQARRLRLLVDPRGAGGPLWLEFSPEGGALVVMQGAPLPRVLMTATLSAAEARTLDNAADPASGVALAQLDALCLAVLTRAEVPAQH